MENQIEDTEEVIETPEEAVKAGVEVDEEIKEDTGEEVEEVI